ncbi:MAG: prepilin-type cleavage/methylation domain-containing protein, partial [Planctomycetota bacterium]
PPDTTVPANRNVVAQYADSGIKDRLFPASRDGSGHTEWANGHSHHSGFTTTLSPNTDVVYSFSGVEYHNIDYASRQEGSHLTSVSYSSVTSRSHHTGFVQSALMDGSVRAFSSQIDLGVWRALGTRDGGEVMGEF